MRKARPIAAARWPVLLAGTLVLAFATHPAQASTEASTDESTDESTDALVWTYEYLLATANTERELAPVAARLIEDSRVYGELPDLELTDFAAEVLLLRCDDPDLVTETSSG